MHAGVQSPPAGDSPHPAQDGPQSGAIQSPGPVQAHSRELWTPGGSFPLPGGGDLLQAGRDHPRQEQAVRRTEGKNK